MSFNGINKTVSRNAGWYVPKYEQCTGTYIFKSKERGSAPGVATGIVSGDFRPVKCIWHKYRCDTCGKTHSSTSSQRRLNQCSREYDIADPRGINILCRKEDDGIYSLIWDIHANDSEYPESYLSYHKIKNLKDADEDDVFGTVQKDGQKWIATSPLTERKFRFKSRTLAITRLRNHLRKEMLK